MNRFYHLTYEKLALELLQSEKDYLRQNAIETDLIQRNDVARPGIPSSETFASSFSIANSNSSQIFEDYFDTPYYPEESILSANSTAKSSVSKSESSIDFVNHPVVKNSISSNNFSDLGMQSIPVSREFEYEEVTEKPKGRLFDVFKPKKPFGEKPFAEPATDTESSSVVRKLIEQQELKHQKLTGKLHEINEKQPELTQKFLEPFGGREQPPASFIGGGVSPRNDAPILKNPPPGKRKGKTVNNQSSLTSQILKEMAELELLAENMKLDVDSLEDLSNY